MMLARLLTAAALALCVVSITATLPAAAVAADSAHKTMTDEEKDRLAREKKELQERAALLKKQLETSQKLVAEKEVLRKQLLQEIEALKAGKK